MGWIPVLMLGLGAAADADDYARMNGTWRVSSMVEEGKVLSARQIAANFAADQVITIEGPTITYRSPELVEPVRRPFTLNAKPDPKEIDLIGGPGGRVVKGIYGVFGDSLMICFPTGGSNPARPSEFSSLPDSDHVILTLKRVSAPATTPGVQPIPVPFTAPKAGPAPAAKASPPAQPVPVAIPAVPPERYREVLVGTWGHQTDDAVAYTTLNPDGTYSATMNWKSGFKKAFHPDVRSSGTWKVEGNMLMFTITASTSAEMRNHVYSFRIVSISGNEAVTVDGMGRLKRDWKVR
jgi:uncharacterized protein (TIGR03067 family)